VCSFVVMGFVLAGASSSPALTISGQIINNSEWKDQFSAFPGDGDGLGRMTVVLLAPDGTELDRRTVTNGAMPLLRGPYSYSLVTGLSNGTYTVKAWLDGDINGVLDTGEPFGNVDVTVTTALSVQAKRLTIIDDNTGNGLPDWWEYHWFFWCLDPFAYGAGDDPDGDGLTNLQEADLATGNYGSDNLDPANWDSDGDGMDDGWEIRYYDTDVLSAYYRKGMNPTIANGTNDFDGDGLSNWQEYCGIDGKPRMIETKGDDGIIKGKIVSSDDLNPLDIDGDYDLLLDSFEAAWYDPANRIDPLVGLITIPTNGLPADPAIAMEDSDQDGLSNFREQALLESLHQSSTNGWIWNWNDQLPFKYYLYTDWKGETHRICVMTDQGGQALNLGLISGATIPTTTNRFLLRHHGWTDPTEGTGYPYADENIPPGHDTDDDGLPDGWEVQFNLDPRDDGFSGDWDNGPYGDPDGDRLMNIEEYYGQDGERSVTRPYINGTGDETNPNDYDWRPDSTYQWRWYNSKASSGLGDSALELGDPGVGTGINRANTLGSALPTASLGKDKGTDSDDDGISDLNEINPPTGGIPSSPVDSCDPFIPRSALITSSSGIPIPAPEMFPSNTFHAAGMRPDLQRRDWTLECQVKLLGTNLTGDLFNFRTLIGGQGCIVYELALSNNAPVLTAQNTRATVFTVSANPLPTNQWVHLAAVWDHLNNSLTLYIDGVLAMAPQPMDESLSKYMFPATNQLALAVSPDGSFVNRLMLDEVRIWGIARTAKQISEYAHKLVPPVNGDDVWIHGVDTDTILVDGGGIFEREPGVPLSNVFTKVGSYWIDDGDGQYDAARDVLLVKGSNVVAGMTGAKVDKVYWNDKDNSGDFTRNCLLAYYRFDDGGSSAEDFARRAKNGLMGATAEEFRFGDRGYALSTNYFSWVTQDVARVYGVDKRGADDSDHDGLPDAWEIIHGLDPWDDGTRGESRPGEKDGPNGARGDPDHDGLINIYEFWAGTNPRAEDTDGDGVLDTQEDRDGDGVVNIDEQLLGSRPDMVDTDDDGVADNEEQSMGTSPINAVDPAISRAVVLGGAQTDYLDIPVSLDQRLTRWTLECWVNPSNATTGAGTLVRRVVETLAGGTQVVNYVMGLETNSAGLRLYAGYVGSDGRPFIVRGGVIPANGSWTHVAATYNPSLATLNLYTNGLLAASTNSFNIAPPVSGRGGQTFVRVGEDYAGGLDEVRVWSSVRSEAQIQANTNRVIASSDTNGLVHYFRFDDGQANTDHFPWGEYHESAGFQDFTFDHDWNVQWRHAAITHGNVRTIEPGAIVPPPSLRVILRPDEVVLAGAQWAVDGGAWQNSGDSVQGLTPGSHTVMYESVSGWTKPITETIILSNGVATTMTRTYIEQSSLIVRFDDVASPIGAAWQVNGGAWLSSGMVVSNLTAGTNVLAYREVYGWFEPPVESVYLAPGQTLQLLREYTVKTSAVSVVIIPTNAVLAGAQWRVDGGAWKNSGELSTGLSLSQHQIQFSVMPRWITSPSIKFTPTNEVTTMLTGRYSQVTGLAVDLFPPDAITLGAQWRVAGGAWTNSGVTLELPAGNYSVQFKAIGGNWLSPGDLLAVVVSEQVTELRGTYFNAVVFGGNISTNAGEFYWPYGLALDTQHRLYVSDTWNDRIQVYDPLSQVWSVIGPKGTNAGQFKKPFGMALDAKNNLFVADQNNNRVQKRNATNNVWAIVGSNSLGSALGQFNQPADVTVDSSLNVYVADFMNDRVQRLSTSGVWSVFVTNGATAGRVIRPQGITADSLDNIYVVDAGSDSNSLSRVQKFSKTGQFISLTGDNQAATGGLKSPAGITLGGGSVYLADVLNNRIAVTPVAPSSWSTLLGGTSLNGPEDTVWDPRGYLYIADTLNSRVLMIPIVQGVETNGMSYISTLVSSGTNTAFTISWFGRLNWNYAVQYTGSLPVPNVWQIVPGCTNIVGLDRMTNCTDRTTLGVTNRFYRIIGY